MPFCMLGPGRKCGPVPDAADISAGYTFWPFSFIVSELVLPTAMLSFQRVLMQRRLVQRDRQDNLAP